MREIEIRERLAPFSHKPGVRLLVPGTMDQVQVFPTRLVFNDRVEELPSDEPVTDFMVVQDLERLQLRLYCNKKLRHTVDSPSLQVLERLSFGSHKKQDWEQMVRRMDPAEILPIWHRMGSLLPPTDGHLDGDLIDLFRARFSDLMIPHAEDVHHLGYPALDLEPQQILRLGYERIRSTILIGNQVMRPMLHSGRLLGAQIEGGKLDLEWSNRHLKRLILHAECDGEIALSLPTEIHSFRARGERLDVGAPIAVSQGEQIHLDQFRK